VGGRTLRLATRGSELALLQADMAAAALAAVLPGAAGGDADGGAGSWGGGCEKVVVQSMGDLRRDVPIHAIGGQGVFVKEIDHAVASGLADVAVHSAKDLPSSEDPEIALGAFLPRADARDALVGIALPAMAAGSRVASGSVRRRAQLSWLRPDLTYVDLRGNIATRLGKVPAGGAVVMAKAALDRLGLAERAAQVLTPTEMLPQVGQGAIALCCRRDDDEMLALLAAIDDAETRLAVTAERAWLRAVGGGCDLPVAAYCTVSGSATGSPILELEAMIASLDGHSMIRDAMEGTDPLELGARLAEQLLGRGGRELLGVDSSMAASATGGPANEGVGGGDRGPTAGTAGR
jgi:hydroxymethylbilane synthase